MNNKIANVIGKMAKVMNARPLNKKGLEENSQESHLRNNSQSADSIKPIKPISNKRKET